MEHSPPFCTKLSIIEINCQSKALFEGSSPKKAKTVLSARKVMAIVFWDSQSVIYIDYLKRAKQSQGSTMLSFCPDSTPKKAPFGEEKVLFHHENVPAYISHIFTVAPAKLVALSYELLPHLPYSLDLVPCDFFLFSNLKE